MSAPLMSRFSARLLVPALALSAIALLGEPIPAHSEVPSANGIELARAEARVRDSLSVALQQEADAIRAEAEAARKSARETAAQMRWFLTLPAAGSRRCTTPACAS